MAMSYEFERHIKAAEGAKNQHGANLLRGLQGLFNSAKEANLFEELPREASAEPMATESPARQEAQAAVAPRIEIKTPLEQAVAEYNKTKPHTPELIASLNRVLWAQISEITGVDVVVPVVAENKTDIEAKESRGKGIIFVPETFAGQAQRPLIAAAFKLVSNEYVPNNWSMQLNNPVKNDRVHTGYRFVDMQIEAPNLRTNEKQAKELMGKGKPEEGAEGMNLSEYALAGLYSKLLTGRYLDEPTWSRLLSSSNDGRVVDASFGSGGYFHVDSGLRPEYRADYLGARFSSGVNKA